MLKNRITRRYRVLLVLILLVLGGCSGRLYEAVKTELEFQFFLLYGLWERITSREVTVEDMREMFTEHRDLMMHIVQTCEEYPRIRKIYVEEGEEYFYGSGETGMEMVAVLESIRARMTKIPASSVSCFRPHNIDGKPLATVSFVVYAVGLSVSGTLKAIDYRTLWSQNNAPLTEEQMEKREYIGQLDKGWYIHVSQR